MTPVSKILSASFVMLALAALTNCTFRQDKTTEGTGANGKLEADAKLDYKMISEVVLKKCTECHGNAGGANLESYPNVKRHIVRVKVRTLDDGTMPPSRAPQLTQCEIDLLDAWIKAGSPETSDLPVPALASCGTQQTPTETATPTPSPTPAEQNPPTTPEEPPVVGNPPPVIVNPPPVGNPNATYSYIFKNIFDKRCTGCHTFGGNAESLPLDPYKDLMATGIVTPGAPDSSDLVKSIERPARGRMPPLSAGPGLTPEEIALIREWIANGAKGT